MSDDVRQELRTLRIAAGLSQSDLARRVQYTAQHVSNVELGNRAAKVEYVVAVDAALGTTPLLATLMQLEGDAVNRRSMVAWAAAALAGGVTLGPEVFGRMARVVLHEHAEVSDWDELAADLERQLISDMSPQAGESIIGSLMLLTQCLNEKGARPDLLRAGGQLGVLYGFWLGNTDRLAEARGWYRTAGIMAERAGDNGLCCHIRARAASRGPYEGYTVTETLTLAKQALHLGGATTTAALEAHAAQVHVHALTNNLVAGRSAVDGMRDCADRLGKDRAQLRTAYFAHFLEARIGSTTQAYLLYEDAAPALRTVPAWFADATIYQATAMVRQNCVDDGIAFALDALRNDPGHARMVKVAVQDLLRVVPADHPDRAELQSFAATGHAPWDVVA